MRRGRPVVGCCRWGSSRSARCSTLTGSMPEGRGRTMFVVLAGRKRSPFVGTDSRRREPMREPMLAPTLLAFGIAVEDSICESPLSSRAMLCTDMCHSRASRPGSGTCYAGMHIESRRSVAVRKRTEAVFKARRPSFAVACVWVERRGKEEDLDSVFRT